MRPINDAPTALPGAATTAGGTSVDIPMSGLINDVETTDSNLALSVGAVTGGAAIVQAGQVVRFTPASGFSGTATVSYTVTDRGDPDNCTGPASNTCDPATKVKSNTLTITVASPATLSVVQRAVSTGTTSAVTSTGLGDDFDVLVTVTNTGGTAAPATSITVRIPASVRPGHAATPTVPAGCTWNGTARAR